MPDMKLDAKYLGGGLAALGMLAAASAGYLTITTPDAQQCAVDLADQRARLELLTTRVELLTEAKDTCKVALTSCGVTP